MKGFRDGALNAHIGAVERVPISGGCRARGPNRRVLLCARREKGQGDAPNAHAPRGAIAPLRRCQSDEPKRRPIIRVERQNSLIDRHSRLRRRIRSNVAGERARA